jgi:hypothetical protein
VWCFLLLPRSLSEEDQGACVPHTNEPDMKEPLPFHQQKTYDVTPVSKSRATPVTGNGLADSAVANTLILLGSADFIKGWSSSCECPKALLGRFFPTG